MKRTLISSATAAVLFTAVTVISNSPLKGDDNDRKRDELEREVEIGFRISPVKLNLKDKDPERVGLGSYIVNAQAGCNDCHTCPSYAPKHNPFPPPFGVSGDGQINGENYLAGGIAFGPPPPVGVVSANLTPDSTGKPRGLTLEQFEIALRTGHDPLDPKFGLLAVMPWPYFRHMTNQDLEAIYAFLRAIPSATPGSCTAAGQ
ncbi:MAG: cytochrome C [Verrucomicrobia bacterium]|nr:cytochrome C [Verrucomicrobiota bacterium]